MRVDELRVKPHVGYASAYASSTTHAEILLNMATRSSASLLAPSDAHIF